MMSGSLVPALLFDDGLLDETLRQALGRSGVQLLETSNVAAGVRLLRDSQEPMVAFFSVSLWGNTLTGLDQVSLLGELLRDETLSQRHAFILVTPTPHAIRAALGRVLERTHVRLLSALLDREGLLAAVWLAATSFAADATTALPAGAN